MKPESEYTLSSPEQQPKALGLDLDLDTAPLSGAERRRQFSRRTSEDLVQFQGVSQVRPTTPMTNLSDTESCADGDERVHSQAHTPTHRSILKSSRQSGNRSPSPDRRVTFHANVLVWAAAEDGDLKTVKTLISAEKRSRAKKVKVGNVADTALDMNMSNHENVTLLHLLCFLRDAEAVSTVIDMGADINAVDREGWTPLHISVALNLPVLSRLLVQHGAETKFSAESGALELSRVSESPHVQPLIKDLEALSAVGHALNA